MNTFMIILSKSKTGRIKNKIITNECGLTNVIKSTKRRRKKWENHVHKTTKTRLIKTAKDLKSQVKRDPKTAKKMKRKLDFCC